jgi:hypothetical protein
MEFTISAMARTRASSSVRPWPSKPPLPGRGAFFGSATIAAAILDNCKFQNNQTVGRFCLCAFYKQNSRSKLQFPATKPERLDYIIGNLIIQ